MKKKALAILLSLLMLTSVTLPGTWANPDETEVTETETTEVDVPEEDPDESDEEETEETEEESDTETDEPDTETEAEAETETEETETETEETEPESESEIEEELESEIDVSEIVEKLLACTTTQEMEEIKIEISEDIWALLTDDQLASIDEHYATLEMNESVTEVFDTDHQYSDRFFTAGPLVGVDQDVWLPENWTYSTYASNDDDGELKLNKTATYNDDGTITISLEAFATGSSITTYVKEGVDIVLMLDLSSYMDDAKLKALKTAVNSFITTVHDEAPSSRIAIVTYGNDASVVTGSRNEKDEALVTVDDSGYQTLTGIVNGLAILGGSSNSHYAADDAVKIFQDVPISSEEYDRQRIAVLFSAGIPGTGWATGDDKKIVTSGQNVGLATMVQAQILKTAKGSTAVPTTSNFDGGLYWSSLSSLFSNVSYNGCGATMYCVGLDIPTSGDATSVDMNNAPYKAGAQANEYFWRMSSHRPDGSHIYDSSLGSTNDIRKENSVLAAYGNTGLSIYKARPGDVNYISLYYFYPDAVTRNQTDGYYFTTESTSTGGLEELTHIFDGIAGSATTVVRPSSSLNQNTVVKDIIAPQFQLPEGTEDDDIIIETYKYSTYNGNFDDSSSWTKNSDSMGATPTVGNDGNVSVTGFDFTGNWCGNAESYTGSNGVHGNKLVIKFTVKNKEGFLGGNDVYTNTSAGVYENATATEPVQTFPRPTVNVEIGNVEVTAEDKNVYLLGSLTVDQIKKGVTVKCGNVDLDLGAENYGLESWQTDYVNITLTYTDKDGNSITDLSNLQNDTAYTVTATVSPKTDGSTTTQGTVATAKTGTETKNINVFKPELTYKDTKHGYGDTAPIDFTGNNQVKVEWKHGDTVAYATMGTAPELSYEYAPADGSIKDGKIAVMTDIPVSVKVLIEKKDAEGIVANTDDVTSYVTFIHTKCTDGTTCNDLEQGKHFWLHITSFDLIIKKTGYSQYEKTDPGQTFVFHVTSTNGYSNTVVIEGDGEVTISGLKAGIYTITEDTDWSWRYEPDGSKKDVTLSSGTTSNEVIFNNKRDDTKWIDGNVYADNIFDGTENVTKYPTETTTYAWRKED